MPYLPDASQPADVVATDSGYDRWAELYDDEFNPLIALEEPRMRALLGDVRNQRVLDVGTGTGRQACWLAQQGADVVAIDFSEGMLAKAQAKPQAATIRFQQQDLHKPWELPDGDFSLAISALVLDHIRDLDNFFTQMARVTQRGGRVLCSVMHPAMMLRGLQARFTDPHNGQRVMPRSAANEISDYLTHARKAGLMLETISEHAVDDALADAQPRAAKYRGWPLLLLMEWKNAG